MLADLLTRSIGSAGLKAGQYDPTTGRLWRLGGVRRQSKYRGRTVDEADALAVPPFWRAFNLVVGSVAMTPIHAYSAQVRLPKQPSFLTQPNPPETRFDTFHRMMAAATLRGNAVAMLGFNAAGWPNVMVPVKATAVDAGRDDDGQVWYRIGGRYYDSTQVLHIRGPVLDDQIGGLGIIEAHRLGISLALTMTEYAGSYFESGGTPSGMVEWPGEKPDPTELDTFKSEWVERFSGSLEPAVVPTGTKFTPIVGHAEEAQLLEARQFSLTESALMWSIDPEWLGAPGSSRTYQNLAGRDTSLVRWTLDPWYVRFEQAFSTTLMTPRPQYVRFNRDALQRGDTAGRLNGYKTGLDMGLYTLDELREWEDLPPLPEPPPPPAPPAELAPATDPEGTPDDSAQ